MSPLQGAKILCWYVRKHGLFGLMRIAVSKLVQLFRNKEAVFVYELGDCQKDGRQGLSNLSVNEYVAIDAIPKEEMDQLVRLKGQDLLLRLLRSFFERGAHLWIAKLDSAVVGMQWTIVGGFDGLYSLPVSRNEIIICAVEVFPAFRGQGIWPAMISAVNTYHGKLGFARSYVKIKLWNKSSLKSIGKTSARQIGIVRTVGVWGKEVSIWDKVSFGSYTKVC